MAKKAAHIKDPKKVAAGKARMAKLRESGELAAFQRQGFNALVEKVGMDTVMEKVRLWRLAHPSQPEQALHEQLRLVGLVDVTNDSYDAFRGWMHYRREFKPLGHYTFDVVLAPDCGVKIAIEVDGAVHRDELFTNDKRRAFEIRRDDQLHAAGWCIVRVSCKDLGSDWWAEQLQQLLETAYAVAQRHTDQEMPL